VEVVLHVELEHQHVQQVVQQHVDQVMFYYLELLLVLPVQMELPLVNQLIPLQLVKMVSIYLDHHALLVLQMLLLVQVHRQFQLVLLVTR